MSYKAKRIVIAVAAAAALFTAASVGTYYYIKGNESAQATENTAQVDNQNNDSNADTQSDNPQSTSNDQNNDQVTENQDRTVANAGTTPAQVPTPTTPAPTPAPTPGTTTTTTNADGTTTRTTINPDGTTTRIRMNNDGTTTTTVTNPDGTIASQTTDANVVTETEESERLVSKDDWVGWSPEAVPVPIMARIANDLGINKYKINVEKEVISTDANEDGKYDIDETITYQVKVSNIGNTTLTGIKISDKINDRENIKSMLLIDENNTLIRKIDDISEYTFDLEAGETAYFEYSYTVKEEDILDGVVENIIVATSEKAEDTDTKTTETEEINEDYEVTKVADKKENVKAGDVVTYTITVKNTGNVTLNDVKVDDDMINLHEVVNGLAPNTETSFTGTYTVKQQDIDDQKVITNIVTVGETTTTEEITPEPENKDYTVEKTAVVTRNGVEVTDKDENGNIIVKAGDEVNYTITVTNTGNVTLTGLKLTDEMLEITEQELEDIAVGGSTSVTGTHTVSQKEVDDQDPIVNTAVVGDKEDTETVVPEEANPDYTVEKTAVVTRNGVEVTDKDENGNIIVKAGDKVNYTITVTNTGNVTLKGLKLTDEMLGITEQELEDIEVGKSIEVTGTHDVSQKEIDDQDPIVNTAVVGNKEDTVIVVPEELPKYPYTVISKVQVIKPVNYILVVDDSTSMANSHVADGTTTRLAAANTAINAFAKALFTNQDTSESTQLTIVRFYGKGKADAIIERKIKDDYNDSTTYTVPKNTNTLGTNMEAGLVLAETYKEPSMENVVIILSDGEINNGKSNAADLKAIVNDNNTEIYSIGFGSEAADPSNSIYKKLQDISTDGKVHSSDGVDTLIAALTGAAYHNESSSEKETTTGKEIIYTGTTQLNMVTLEYKNLTNPITARFNNGPGNYGIFTYSLDNGIYTLSVDFSQYLDKDDLTITYYKKATQSKKSNTETLDNIDANKSESLNMKPLSSDAKNESLSKEDLTSIQDEAIANKEEDSIVKEKANNETTNITEKDNNDAETNKEETELKEDEEEKEKQSASDTKESEEKEDEKLVPEHDTEKTETSQTEKTETNEVIEENPNIINTEILEKAT